MKSGIAMALAASLACMAQGRAADLRLSSAPAPQRQPAATAFPSWAGPYIGAQAGYLSGRSETSFSGTGELHSVDPKGFSTGFSAGYSMQWGRFVGGLEGDLNFVGAKATIDTGFAPDPSITQLQSTIDWNSHWRARVGYAFDRTLIFAAGGLAIAGVENRAFDNGAGTMATWNDTRIGWTIGGGVEYRVAPQASVRLEYLYDNYGTRTLATQTLGATTFPSRESKLDSHTLRAGVHWHF
ncbi:outer membrane protein [Bradyrhizobium roseum]|uniref:outer membrane protein n=1 Tax=Bradyrhizobium roseum TaxID=3056648 RepID=UPI002605B56C|nr:outer membrane beta-barrel protein [Bradyrhizobium roseus]WKA28640.1 outer membrane beta-barrel protein [Bradyrhizobium roseus]